MTKTESLNKQFWKDILTIDQDSEKRGRVLRRYRDKMAVCRLTISSFAVWQRFQHLNQDKSYREQVKPYNFITVGVGHQYDQGTGMPIIPMLPYIAKDSEDFLAIPHMAFMDYKTGAVYDNGALRDGQLWTRSYWKPLSRVLVDYMDHAESKSVCDKDTHGFLERRHLVIGVNSVHYIGKETNNLEEADAIGLTGNEYTEYIHWAHLIKGLTPKQAVKIGISKRNLSYLKQKIEDGKPICLKVKTMMALLKLMDDGGGDNDE